VRQTMLEGFQAAWAANPGQDPQIVADAIVSLLGLPDTDRPFRTVVDNMGMADAVGPLNQTSDAVTQGLYGAFGMVDMLTVRN